MKALLTLNALPKTGPIRIRRLLSYFGSADEVLRQNASTLREVSGIGAGLVDLICNHRAIFDADKELAACEKRDISIITQDSEGWPEDLSIFDDAPVLLYVRGELKTTDRHAIAIVGSRRCTHYGREVTRQFASHLARAGHCILSGLALGIDTVAHQAALEAGGRTVAIIGSGLARLYPPENEALAKRIADGCGAVVSEFPLQAPPDKQAFPQRNRIVAAWAKAVLVTECPRRSGSLITARFASDWGKPVFAVPGPIDRPNSEGCHALIRDGAQLAHHPDQLLTDMTELPLFSSPIQLKPLDSPPPRKPPLPELDDHEALVLAQLDSRERTIDEIATASGLPVYVVSTSLLKLEIRDLARQLAGQRYVRRANT